MCGRRKKQVAQMVSYQNQPRSLNPALFAFYKNQSLSGRRCPGKSYVLIPLGEIFKS